MDEFVSIGRREAQGEFEFGLAGLLFALAFFGRHLYLRLMTTKSLLALIAALSALPVIAQDATQTELQKLEKIWNEAHIAGDAATLDKLWAEELVVTVPKMPMFDKKQSLAIWKTGRMKFNRYETSDLGFKIFGDTAVVTGALVRERNFVGKDIHEDWRFTKVYVKQDGKWRVVAWHASDAAPKSEK
jgi:ketosteroid isomerase-like protein